MLPGLVGIGGFVATATGGSGSAHRYWRLYVDSNNGDASFTVISELQMRTVSGGSDVTTTGAAISGGSGADGTGAEASKAFDDSSTTGWQRSATGSCYVGQDFGAGNEKAIVEVTVNAGTNTPSLTTFQRMPKSGKVEYSDDGSTWTTSFTFGPQFLYVAGQDFAYPTATPGTGQHLAWRVFATGNNGGTLLVIGQMQYRATSGGSDQTVPLGSNDSSTLGRVIYTHPGGAGNEAYRCFNNAAGTFAQSGVTANAGVGFIFTSPVAVQEITLQGSSTTSRSPNQILIQYTDDGITWTTAATYSSLTWTASEIKTFSVP